MQLTGKHYRYTVQNRYGFNTRIPVSDSLQQQSWRAWNPNSPASRIAMHYGEMRNIPSRFTSGELRSLSEILSLCGVEMFDFECFIGGAFDGAPARGFMNYIYPAVRKHGPDVFRDRRGYLSRNGGTGPYTSGHRVMTASALLEQHRETFPLAYNGNAASDAAYKAAVESLSTILSNPTKEPTMSENNYDPQTGVRIQPAYQSRIVTGDELSPGKQYRIEVVGGKNPPEALPAGTNVTALADSEGNYEGYVRLNDGSERTFITDASDLYLKA